MTKKTMIKKTRKLDTGILHRTIQIRADDINADSRTVALAFSSEEPVSRWYGKEVLSHEPEAPNLGRLRSGGALLVDHDVRDQIGVVENVSIDSDRRGRSIVRFGQSARAEEIYQDVLNGIRQNVSVGYSIEEMTEDRETDTFTATRWTPMEISIVSIPADASVGIGRDAESESHETIVNYLEERTMDKDIKETPATPKPVDVELVRGEAIKAEQKRTSEMLAIGREYDCADLAETAIRENASVDDLTRKVLASMKDSKTIETPTLDLSTKEIENFSLFRALRAQESGNYKKAGFELACSQAIAEQSGKEARGIFLPNEIRQHAHNAAVRAMTVESATAGGYLVNDEPQSLIEYLYANTVMGQVGATYLNGLVGDVPIPKMTGKSTIYWLSEDEDGTDSEPTLGQVVMMPHTAAGAVPMSRKLMLQSNPSVEAMVMNDLNRSNALAMDDVALSGDGFGGQPLGVLNHTGIATSTIATAATPTWIEMIEFETDVDTSNALMGSLNFVTTPAIAGALKAVAKDAGSGQFVMTEGKVNGYNVHTTTQLAASTILFGDFSSVILGMWGTLDVVADLSTKAKSGGLVIRTFQDCDVGVRHIESFCKNVT